MFNKLRDQMCELPLAVEVRDATTKENILDIPELVLNEINGDRK